MSIAGEAGAGPGSRLAFSTLAFPDAPSMPAADRAQVSRTLARSGLPAVAVDSSIRLTDDHPGPELRRRSGPSAA